MVKGKNNTNLIFDLVVPHSYGEADEQDLLKKVKKRIHDIYHKTQCVITVDKKYVADA